MIATALALQTATQDAVHDDIVMAHASRLFHARNEMDNEDFAKALFEARSELGALGKDVDGTTANLEDLIKAGRITNDVLIKTLPLLSKSSLLFGKLGTSAGSAVDALKRGVEGVTITQVEAQIQNLNQKSKKLSKKKKKF